MKKIVIIMSIFCIFVFGVNIYYKNMPLVNDILECVENEYIAKTYNNCTFIKKRIESNNYKYTISTDNTEDVILNVIFKETNLHSYKIAIITNNEKIYYIINTSDKNNKLHLKKFNSYKSSYNKELLNEASNEYKSIKKEIENQYIQNLPEK